MKNSLLKEIVKKLPSSPGIYIFKNRKNKPLYIGKAFNLKGRVNSYLKLIALKLSIESFRAMPRLQEMISGSESLDYIQTGSDIEALILESQYIKKFQPPFNIMLRDDKQYFYVGLTNELFTKLFLTHQPIMANGKWQMANGQKKSQDQKLFALSSWHFADYVGPFTDGNALKTTLRLLRKIFPYCTCRQPHNNYCLNYHINKCLGYCCLKNPELRITCLAGRQANYELREYRKNIKAIKDILSGKRESLITQFEKEVQKLGKEHKFEEALELQYKIEKLKIIFKNAKIINKDSSFMIYHKGSRAIDFLQKLLNLRSPLRRIEAYDIANIQGKHAVGAMAVFTDGRPDKNEYRKFKILDVTTCDVVTKTSKVKIGDTGMLKEVLTRRFNHSEWPYPDLIIVDGGKAQLNAAISVISGSRTSYGSPTSITVIALAKNERHIGEKIFFQNKKDPISLSKLPGNIKNLLLRINSEAHRFVINYYRKLHQKKALRP